MPNWQYIAIYNRTAETSSAVHPIIVVLHWVHSANPAYSPLCAGASIAPVLHGRSSAGRCPCTPIYYQQGGRHIRQVNKTKHISFRLTEKEYKTIMEKIKLSGLSISEFMLAACFRQRIKVVDGLKLSETRRKLSAIGNNLNQLTTLANMGRIQTTSLCDATVALRECHSALSNIRDEVQKQ